MATLGVASRSVFRATSTRSTVGRFASLSKSARLQFRSSARGTRLPSLRFPVELSSSLDSLLPYHTATASALMTSMLSTSRHSYGWLSGGIFASFLVIYCIDPI